MDEDPVTRGLISTVSGSLGWKPFWYPSPQWQSNLGPSQPRSRLLIGHWSIIRNKRLASGMMRMAYGYEKVARTTSESHHLGNFTEIYQGLKTQNLG